MPAVSATFEAPEYFRSQDGRSGETARLASPESEKLAETIRSAASDEELFQECVKIAIYCLAFADHLKLKSLKTLGELALAGFVANIGKSRIPARIRMRIRGWLHGMRPWCADMRRCRSNLSNE
jgi:HD-GYP domain-containing protein (c-di-GMP phosphodiesterase class II)